MCGLLLLGHYENGGMPVQLICLVFWINYDFVLVYGHLLVPLIFPFFAEFGSRWEVRFVSCIHLFVCLSFSRFFLSALICGFLIHPSYYSIEIFVFMQK